MKNKKKKKKNKCTSMGLSFGMLNKSYCTNDICVASHLCVSKI